MTLKSPQTNTVLVSLQNSHYRGCSLDYLHWFEGPLILESLEFLVNLILQGIRDRSRRVKSRFSVWVHINSGFETLDAGVRKKLAEFEKSEVPVRLSKCEVKPSRQRSNWRFRWEETR